MISGTRQWSLLAPASCVVLACGNAAPNSADLFSEQDSAGIRIASTVASEAQRPLDWVVSEAPQLQIGSESAGDDYVFHRIAGSGAFSDGRIVVVDGGSLQLRVFDRDGVILSKFGRRGSGPGEFRSMRLLSSSASDTAFVHDISQRRLTYYAVDSGEFGTMTLAVGARGIGITDGGVVLADQTIMFRNTAGPSSTPVTYLMQGRGTQAVDTIGTFQGAQTYTTLDLGELPWLLTLPFTASSTAAAAGSRIYLYDGTSSDIRVYSSEAALTGLFRITGAKREVTRQQHQAYLEQQVRRIAPDPKNEPLLRRVFGSLDIPEEAAMFRRLIIDETGMLWAETVNEDRDAPSTWMVFAVSGRVLGTVNVPRSLDVHYIGIDHVLGRCRDAHDVEHVCKHELRRGAE
jgi:hypothetical protein